MRITRFSRKPIFNFIRLKALVVEIDRTSKAGCVTSHKFFGRSNPVIILVLRNPRFKHTLIL